MMKTIEAAAEIVREPVEIGPRPRMERGVDPPHVPGREAAQIVPRLLFPEMVGEVAADLRAVPAPNIV
jgi:hypothetical protein